jgi:hypothetical protein
MKIIVRIGTTGIGGGLDEKLEFSNPDDAVHELTQRAPELTASDIKEILSSPDTQFERSEMIIAETGDAAYWGGRRYEIEVHQ